VVLYWQDSVRSRRYVWYTVESFYRTCTEGVE
jgi:hypothetical protein